MMWRRNGNERLFHAENGGDTTEMRGVDTDSGTERCDDVSATREHNGQRH